MQARGVTEKSYVEQCKGGAEPSAAAPAPKPAEAAPPAPKRATSTGSKTAKDCTAEWRADKAGMQARGITERAYVEGCKQGALPTAVAPPPKPSVVAPSPSPVPTQTTSSPTQKTAKECVAEWRADKAGMQARGTTEKAYVEQCKRPEVQHQRRRLQNQADHHCADACTQAGVTSHTADTGSTSAEARSNNHRRTGSDTGSATACGSGWPNSRGWAVRG